MYGESSPAYTGNPHEVDLRTCCAEAESTGVERLLGGADPYEVPEVPGGDKIIKIINNPNKCIIFSGDIIMFLCVRSPCTSRQFACVDISINSILRFNS